MPTLEESEWSCALRRLVAPYGWGNPVGCGHAPASAVLPLEAAGRGEGALARDAYVGPAG
jgi:hypothetical protein